MKLRMEHGLLFANADLTYRRTTVRASNVLLDTGSAGTLFAADRLIDLGLRYERDDRVHRIRGVGGSEFVFTKRVEELSLSNLRMTNFEIEVGAMNYGFEIDGIIGMDFLLHTGAVIDLTLMELRSGSPR